MGLHAQTKDGEVVKVQVPKDCLIIQIGEAMEVPLMYPHLLPGSVE